MGTLQIQLDRTPRLTAFPYPVFSAGWYENVRLNTDYAFQQELFEVCFRIGSPARQFTQCVGTHRYLSTFPHVLLKIPREYYHHEPPVDVDTFAFRYPAGMMEQFRQAGMLDELWCWDVELTPDLVQLLKKIRILMAQSQQPTISDQLDTLCFQLYQHLIFARKRARDQQTTLQEKINAIASYFQLHFHELPDMDEVAERFGMSRCAFFRNWKRCYDQSPARYLQNLKLQEAIRRLVETHDSISEIAQQLHFQETNYFCAVFRKNFGITPLQYRKLHQAGALPSGERIQPE